MSAGVSERLLLEGALEIRLRARAGAFLPVRCLSGYPVVAVIYAAAQGGGLELLKTKFSRYSMVLLTSKGLMAK